MNERGYYFTQPDGQGIVFSGDVGVPNPGEGPPARPITRAPITSTFRKIGSPGVWNDITTWWTGLKAEHKWGIGALGGLGLLGIIIAATRKGEAETGLKKI